MLLLLFLVGAGSRIGSVSSLRLVHILSIPSFTYIGVAIEVYWIDWGRYMKFMIWNHDWFSNTAMACSGCIHGCNFVAKQRARQICVQVSIDFNTVLSSFKIQYTHESRWCSLQVSRTSDSLPDRVFVRRAQSRQILVQHDLYDIYCSTHHDQC
jgi:hypothetical protein